MARKNARVARSSKRRHNEIEFLNTALDANILAITEGPKKKRWTTHDLRTIRPLTDNQESPFRAWFENPQEHLALLGSAGVGKSFLAVYLAFSEMFEFPEKYHTLKIVRSLVQSRQIGALPGTLEEKKQPIFAVYDDIFQSLFIKSSTFRHMCEAGIVELVDTTYIRGATWDNCIVLVDEVNNMNMHELNTVMTRIGDNARVIVAGDQKQSDLILTSNKQDKYDHNMFLKILNDISTIHKVIFTPDDIVRSGFTKLWIKAYEKHS
jgi:phosphate starvation-inducible protein PhoH and related proteins